MAYDVNKTDGTLLTSIPDGTLDVSTSIRLVGKNYAGYGEVMAENLVAMLENFAYSTPPANPVFGQLWFNKTNKALSVFDSSGVWKEITNRYVRDTEPLADGNRAGDFWFQPTGKQLSVWDGVRWVPVGFPYNNTIEYVTVRDVDGVYHDAIVHFNLEKVIPGDTTTYVRRVMAVMSADAYTPHDTETTINPNAVSKQFPIIGKGFNLPIRPDVKFRGVAIEAEFADLAEYYTADAIYEPGTVLKLGGNEEVTQTVSENDDAVFGVVSTNPAFILNGAGFRNGAKVPVALVGRVPVLVTGPVKKGDRLVSSSLPGVATVARWTRDPYTVIGRSLVNCDDPGVRSIEAVVGVK